MTDWFIDNIDIYPQVNGYQVRVRKGNSTDYCHGERDEYVFTDWADVADFVKKNVMPYAELKK